jgi:hypothetical protein
MGDGWKSLRYAYGVLKSAGSGKDAQKGPR